MPAYGVGTSLLQAGSLRSTVGGEGIRIAAVTGFGRGGGLGGNLTLGETAHPCRRRTPVVSKLAELQFRRLLCSSHMVKTKLRSSTALRSQARCLVSVAVILSG